MLKMAQYLLVLLLLHLLIVSGDLLIQQQQTKHNKKQSSPSQPSPQQQQQQQQQLTRDRKPNIVLILTDDQDVELGSLTFMPKTLRMIRDQGAEFRHAYVTTPMCCPSRSSLLTGMYMHNHHVYTNNDNCSSTQWQATYETRSFATYLSNAGYRTGYFGKYLNKYNGSYIPPGWREWGGLIMNSKYYNYSINMNGKKIKHGFDYHKDYYSDLIANDSIAFLRQSKKNNQHKPVMLTMSFPAPHGPEDSAPQYSHLFFNVTTHHTPSYDYAPNPDKQWILQVTKKMEPIHRQFTDLLMTKRLQTLQSVDDAVQRVVQELESLGELHNTYIVYTSDHGYHLGQFGLIKGKSFPFEFDVRVPFLVRGPGVEPGSSVDDIVLNIDLAPTFLQMAGVEPPPHMDGRSVLPLFLNSKRNKRPKWPDTFLIESSGRRETPYLDSRMKNKLNGKDTTTQTPFTGTTKGFVENFTSTTTHRTTLSPQIYESGEEVTIKSTEDDDLDDLDDDEDNMENNFDIIEENNERYFEENNGNMDLDDNSKDLLKVPDVQLDNQLLPLPVTKLERLSIECVQESMMFPCKVGQKWFCQNINGRWRKHKCKSNFNTYNTMNIERPYRKCACFTPNGVVYKKIPLQSVKKRDLVRLKRDTDLDELLFERLNEEKFRKLSKREKRDTLAHIEKVMNNVHGEINSLARPINLQTNRIVDGIPGCIFQNGSVNCSSLMYLNKKSWRQSRHQIDNEIQVLKHKLETLKEIRKQLKQTKPVDLEENKEDENEEEDSDEEDDDFLFDEFQNRTQKRKKQTVRFQYVNVTTEGPRSESYYSTSPKNIYNASEFTTASPIMSHTNPHRHGHHKFVPSTSTYFPTTTTKVYREDLSTETIKKRTTTTTPPSRIKQEDPNKSNICHCNDSPATNQLIAAQEEKRRIKQERLRKKLRRQRRKDQLEKECGLERMNCFHHDNDHWRTAPLWTAGPFCFCMNANNNTYSCVRTINSTHNFLYCEFTTGLVTFYNLRMDPFELHNGIDQLKPEERSYLHDLLEHLMACKGRSCTINHHNHHHQQHNSKHRASVLQLHTTNNQPRLKKRKFVDDFGVAARTLPLVQSELLYRTEYTNMNRVHKRPWRRRKTWQSPAATYIQDRRERKKSKSFYQQ